VIAADADVATVAQTLTKAELEFAELPADSDSRISVVPASLAKGLEYDHVVVFEPSRIVAAEERGLRRLYVVLTRAVSSLTVVHHQALPEPLQLAWLTSP
jgi:DNA helicase IV